MNNRTIIGMLAILLISAPSFAQQTNPKVDAQRCFKSLCLGPIGDWWSKAFKWDEEDDIETYRVEPKGEFAKVFDLPISNLYFDVYNDTIVHIEIYTKDLRDGEYALIDDGMKECNRIKSKLEMLMGEPSGEDFPLHDSEQYVAQWRGEKTVVDLYYLWHGSKLPVNKIGHNLRIDIWDWDFALKRMQGGF